MSHWYRPDFTGPTSSGYANKTSFCASDRCPYGRPYRRFNTRTVDWQYPRPIVCVRAPVGGGSPSRRRWLSSSLRCVVGPSLSLVSVQSPARPLLTVAWEAAGGSCVGAEPTRGTLGTGTDLVPVPVPGSDLGQPLLSGGEEPLGEDDPTLHSDPTSGVSGGVEESRWGVDDSGSGWTRSRQCDDPTSSTGSLCRQSEDERRIDTATNNNRHECL